MSSTMSSTIAVNFFLAVALKISMKRIWGIINFLQLVTHLPYIITNLPSNFTQALQLIYDAANIKIIPQTISSEILNKIFNALDIEHDS